MVNSDASPVFIDTNILVYANIKGFPLHQVALEAIQTLFDAEIELWISRQVLREFIVCVTRPQTYAKPQPIEIVIERIQGFQDRFQVADDTAQVTAKRLELLLQNSVGGKQIHDANIVATLLTIGVHRLLTHNTKDFERFSQFIQILPLEFN